MKGRSTLPDASDRRAAVTDFEHNLVVLAGAGTGKTSLLVERVLNAVGSGRVEIDGLAAITFTEKAAAEMRQRAAEGLEALRAAARGEREPDSLSAARRALDWLVGDGGVEPDQVARRALDALEKLDRAKILTIHGFCSEILRAHPLEAGVEPDFEVDRGELAKVLGDELWDDFLAGELGGEAERGELWERLLSRVKLADLAEVAVQLGSLGVPDEPLRRPADAPTARELFADEAKALVEEIDAVLKRASGMNGRFERFLETMAGALRALIDEGPAGFATAVAAGGPDAAKILDNNLPAVGARTSGVDPDQAKELGKRVKRLGARLLQADDALSADVVEALAPFADRLRNELLRRGWVGFDGLLALARDLLRDHETVRRELKKRFDMLLVDEFQDTDPLQYEIVLFLAEGVGECERDAWNASLQPGKLFVVGDPKQSIYRFRGADFAAFNRTVERIVVQGGKRLDLVANFRSVENLVEPVNALFAAGRSASWKPSDYQPPYEPIHAVRPSGDDDPSVEIWTLRSAGDSRAERRRRYEGEAIACAIDRLVRQEKKTELRRVAVLFRTFASIPYYLRPLREREIPFVVDGGKDFIKRPEIAQSLAVLKTLAQPADPIALLAFLRSPAGAVADTELAVFGDRGNRWDWRVPLKETEGIERIAECFDLLRGLRRETRDLPADAVVRRVMDRTCLLPLAAAAFEGAQRVANLEKLAAAAGRLARDGRLSLEDVVDQLQEGGLADLEADSPLSDDAANAVRITSIHKMKGLEADWVFLPDLGRWDHPPPAPDNDCRVTWPGALGPVLALRVGGISNAAWALHEAEGQRHEDAEETRVLYVALTRARDRLVLLGSPSRNKTRWYRTLSAWGYDIETPPDDGATLMDGRVLHRAVDARRRRPPVAVREAEPPEQAVDLYRAAVERLEAGAGWPFGSPSAAEGRTEADHWSGDRDRGAVPAARSRDLGMAVGRVVHRMLESWDGVEPDGLRRTAAWLCEREAEETDGERSALEAEVTSVVNAFLGSPLVARFRDAGKMGREVPLLLRDEDGRSWRGSIDLLYRDDDGSVVVADYKTDDEDDDRVLLERYQPQLDIYREAVRRGLDLPGLPRAELWLLRTGKRVPIPDSPPDDPSSGDSTTQGTLF